MDEQLKEKGSPHLSTPQAGEPLEPSSTFTPLALNLSGLSCLVVGGGAVGTRKILALLKGGARVNVVAPSASSPVASLARKGLVTWHRRRYHPEFLRGAQLVVAATSDVTLNEAIAREAEKQGLWYCVASSGAASRFLFPATFACGPLCVSVHSHGTDVRKACALRDRVARFLGASAQQSSAGCAPPRSPAQPTAGKVSFVGAGLGPPDLLTLRASLALQRADVVIADYLVPLSEFHAAGLIPPEATLLHLSNEPRRRDSTLVGNLLRNHVSAGKNVVRLKNGDPGVFGRHAGEIELCTRQGFAWEVIPGISAALGALTEAGLPLTRRGAGRSFAVATARAQGGTLYQDLPVADSLVLLMAVGCLQQTVQLLRSKGYRAETPACILERVGLPWERRVFCTLRQLPQEARSQSVAPPAVVVVGEAARRPDSRLPTILFTGTAPRFFRSLGSVLHWPAHMVEPVPGWEKRAEAALRCIAEGSCPWIVFSDRTAVRNFLRFLLRRGHDTRALGGITIVATGADTDCALEDFGLRADLYVPTPRARLIAEELPVDLSGQRVLLLSGIHAPSGLGPCLRRRGAQVLRVNLLRLRPHPELGKPLPEYDVAYFVSPSAVRVYERVYGEKVFARELWCLGEQTARRLRKAGFPCKIVTPPELCPTR